MFAQALRGGVKRLLAVCGLVLPLDRVQGLRPGPLRTFGLAVLDLRYRYFTRDFESETIYGFRVRGNTGDYIQRRLFVFGVWEPALSEWLSATLEEGDIFVDVGANIGYFSLLGSQLVGPSGSVVAFEALPSVADQLDRNLMLNDVHNVTALRKAVSDVAGEIEIFRAPAENSGESSTVASAGFTSEGRVEAIRLDDVPLKVERIRVVKIDVEGDEFRVLRGAGHLLERLVPGSFVVTEVSPDRLIERQSSSTELLDFMFSLGYEAHVMPNNYSTLAAARGGVAVDPGPSVVTRVEDQQDVLFRKISAMEG